MAHVDVSALNQEDRIKALNAIRRGHVLLVVLAGARGREERKTRPCVVVSNDKLNAADLTLIVVPITTHGASGKVGAHEIALSAGDGELDENSAAQPCQVRTVDRFERVIEIWGVMPKGKLDAIADKLWYAQSDS